MEKIKFTLRLRFLSLISSSRGLFKIMRSTEGRGGGINQTSTVLLRKEGEVYLREFDSIWFSKHRGIGENRNNESFPKVT